MPVETSFVPTAVALCAPPHAQPNCSWKIEIVESSWVIKVLLLRLFHQLFGFQRDEHLTEQLLNGHGVAVKPVLFEIFGIAIPFAVIVSHNVFAIVTTDNNLEIEELKPISFLCITMCLLNFADVARVHHVKTSSIKTKRHVPLSAYVPFLP
jgi:hypothetical protein